jgi:LPS export ABC transporter protein LptC
MQSRVKYLKFLIPVIFPGLLLISSCENDLNKVRAVTAADATKPVQKTTGVTIIYSDSAVLKAVVTAPVLYEYLAKKPYKEMPNGVKIVFYTKGLKEGQLTADTALNYDEKKLIIFRKNVVATKIDGTTYKSEELYYDQIKKELYSNKQVIMTKVNGEQITGTSFKTDDKFKNPVFQNSTAIIHVDGDGIAP